MISVRLLRSGLKRQWRLSPVNVNKLSYSGPIFRHDYRGSECLQVAALFFNRFRAVFVAVVLVAVSDRVSGASLPMYQKSSGVSGNLSSVGSDTLASLLALWAEDFKRIYPNANVQVQGTGSSTAPTALTESIANIGPMSREMHEQELQAFERKHGYKPTAIPVAIDALAIFVNKDNPLQGLTMAQVDAIFSATGRCGGHGDIRTWGDLGLDGVWRDRPLQLYGRNAVSGSHELFRQKALCRGDFKNTVNEQSGSASVVQSVAGSLNGIGYSGTGYKNASVKMVPLARDADGAFAAATSHSAFDGSYPLTRYLYIYVNKQPGTALAPLEREFIRMILSRQGQEVVVKSGYIPLPDQVVNQYLAWL